MKFFKTLLVGVFALFSTALSAQETGTVWNSKVDNLGDGFYSISVTATIPADRHIYALGELGGYNPTVITFTSEQIQLVGDLVPSSEPHKYYDDMYKMDMADYSGSVTFTQRVAALAENVDVEMTIDWQECSDENCFIGEKAETISLGAEFTTAEAATAAAASFEAEAVVEAATAAAASFEAEAVAEADEAEEENADPGFWGMIIEAIIWGFAALLTPCVFPMIPMTVSFFMKGSANKARAKFRAIMYGVFIVSLYTLPIAALIIITHVAGGDAVTADIFNWLGTHWLPNIIFFIVFMVFAASFFGAFEIVLPSKLVNKSDENVDKKKGLGGVFFLALTLVLVSFSCTGPIVGSVLIKATQGEVWTPIFAMMAFALAFSIPFVLCALFPGLLNKMPKSGGWLNSVKVVLGFVEIALGLKFLSTADQVYHWGILDREIYLAIWIVCFTLLGFYLLGKLKFKHDSEVKHISTFRLFAAIGVFSFVVYMIPGMWGAPLKGLSGYMPPLQSQDFVLSNGGSSLSYDAYKDFPKSVKYGDFLELPHGLKGFYDLEEAKEYAAKVGKPIFLDVTGHGCVNCRNMEASVWSDEGVKERLVNEFVICALYVDDKTELPAENWVKDGGKTLKTLGKINSAFVLKEFNAASQPFYAVLDAEGNKLGKSRSYNLDVDAFIAWMDKGLEIYKTTQK